MAKKKLKDAIEELQGWLPNLDSAYVTFFFRMMATLPFGDDFEDIGYEPLIEGGQTLGWMEMQLLENLLVAIESKEDMEYVAQELIYSDIEDEDDDDW
jgi:hypothetical protein